MYVGLFVLCSGFIRLRVDEGVTLKLFYTFSNLQGYVGLKKT